MANRTKVDPSALCETTKELQDCLSSRIVSQPMAVNCITNAYDYYNSPLWEPEKPILCAMFLGPSGVGKTYAVEVLAEYLFDNPKAFTKIECGSYQHSHEISKLIGSPPGYAGYGELPLLSQQVIDAPGIEAAKRIFIRTDPRAMQLQKEIEKINDTILSTGEETPYDQNVINQLIRKYNQKINELCEYAKSTIKNKPVLSIVLFDEIEKANESIYNFLLEITSKGRIRLGNGAITNFYHSFIFMTSNIGSRAITEVLKGKKDIGFSEEKLKPGSDPLYDKAINEFRKHFSTEFIGRLGKNIVVFKPLSKENLRKIFHLHVQFTRNRLSKNFPLLIKLSGGVEEFILNKAIDHPEYGARLIQDKLDKYLNEPLGRLINSGQVFKSDTVWVTLENGKICFSKEERENKKLQPA